MFTLYIFIVCTYSTRNICNINIFCMYILKLKYCIYAVYWKFRVIEHLLPAFSDNVKRYGFLPFIFIKMPNCVGTLLRRRPSLSTLFYCRLVLNWNKSRLFPQCLLALSPTGSVTFDNQQTMEYGIYSINN